MTSLTLSMTESMRVFVEEQVAKGRDGSVEEYLRSLILVAQEHEAQEHLEGLLLGGLDSGDPVEVNEEYWERFRSRLRERRSQVNG